MQTAATRSWLWLNFKIGALSVGVASRLLLFEEAMVREHQWVSADEFQELLTLAQMLPGPNLVNFAACAGSRLVPGWVNLTALLLLITPGALMAIMIFAWAPLTNPHIKELFRGFAIGAFLLTARFLWTLASGLKSNGRRDQKDSHASVHKIIGRYVIALALVVISFYHIPALPLIGSFAALCLAWEFLF